MTCGLECTTLIVLILVFSAYITFVLNRTFNAKR